MSEHTNPATAQDSPGIVMVVDDVPENLKQLCEMLERGGYRVMPAQDGFMALRAAEAVTPDLILLDIRMPELDGFEVCTRLKHDPALRDVPVIFISALGDAADKMRAFAAGGVDYVTKPFQHGEVLARVKTHLDLRRTRVSLRQARDILEERVQERTAELEERTARLRDSESRVRGITDAAQDAIVMMNADGCVTFWNPAAERILGYAETEALGGNLHELLAPAHHLEAFKAAFPEFRLTGAGKHVDRSIEVTAFRKDGQEIDVSLSLSALRIQGQWNAVGIIRDITERNRMQAMMMQTEKMMSLGGLAAGMAHEINNPLGAITQNAQVLAMRLGGNVPANLGQAEAVGCELKSIQTYMEKRGVFTLLDSIRESVTKATNIVRNMLEFSRRSESRKESAVLSEILDKALELASNDFDLKKKYDFRQIQIIKNYEPDVPAIVCSRVEIEQVVLNLLKNAVQAMSVKHYDNERPTITLSVTGQGDTVRLIVADNGPGMEPAVQKRAFEPFFTTKPVGEGTGLGLSVSHFIIATNHGGAMEAQSNPGEGTSFIITLPLRQNAAQTTD